ncbi:hypothetical protein BpHYR1_006528, partial [Brachionus plicatilis]
LFIFLSSALPRLFLNFSFPFLRVEERRSRGKEKLRKSRRTKCVQHFFFPKFTDLSELMIEQKNK